MNNWGCFSVCSFRHGLHYKFKETIEDVDLALHTALDCQNSHSQRKKQQHLSTIQNKLEPTENATASHEVASTRGPRLAEIPACSNVLLMPRVSS